MKLQDLTLQQLKEIVDGAPEGATHWNSNEKDDCWKYIKYDGADNYSLDDEGNWETSMEFHSHAKHGFLKLSDIRARIDELEPVFKVGDWVVILQDTKTLDERYVHFIDDVDYKLALISGEWIYLKNLRHATPEEIAAGHRIDTISDEMASPCTASDLAKNKAQMNLQENEPDIITDKLDPKKCRIVDPALPYDEPTIRKSRIADFKPDKVLCDMPIDAELKVPAGQKHDQSKPRYSLIPADALAAIVGVLEYGATKYAPNNWKRVENARERYYNASMRHIQAWWSGEQNDPETNLPHLAHAACSLMFLMWLDGEQGE